jgi:hypothetical protein
VLEQGHLVFLAEVTEKPDKKTNVSHLVHQVLVLQFLWLNVAQSLIKTCSALTVSTNEAVVHHLASFALQVLHLVGKNPLVQDLN